MRRDPQALGPHREDPCPCGSHRRARSCHRKADGTWKGEYPALNASSSTTGRQVEGCYASALADCDGSLTREHYISADVLRAVGDLKIGGMPWQENATQMIGVGINSLVAKVLCRRHNSMLSPLDAEAGHVFRTILEFQSAQSNPSSRDVDDFRLVSGPKFELWMLKTLLAMWASSIFSGVRPRGTKLDLPNLPDLLHVLFGGGEWQETCGLYIIGDRGSYFRARDVEIVPHCVDGETITGLTVCLRHVTFELVLRSPLPPWHKQFDTVWRPGGVLFEDADSAARKVLALGWPEDGNPHRLGTFLRPRVIDRETGERVQ